MATLSQVAGGVSNIPPLIRAPVQDAPHPRGRVTQRTPESSRANIACSGPAALCDHARRVGLGPPQHSSMRSPHVTAVLAARESPRPGRAVAPRDLLTRGTVVVVVVDVRVRRIRGVIWLNLHDHPLLVVRTLIGPDPLPRLGFPTDIPETDTPRTARKPANLSPCPRPCPQRTSASSSSSPTPVSDQPSTARPGTTSHLRSTAMTLEAKHAGETTLSQMARLHLSNESRYLKVRCISTTTTVDKGLGY